MDEDLKEVTIRGIHNAVIAVSNALARCNKGPLIRDKKHVRKVLDILKDTRQLCDKARQSKTLESFNKTAEAFQPKRNKPRHLEQQQPVIDERLMQLALTRSCRGRVVKAMYLK
ncbi:hypothetical protein DPMN_049197 [Dreissena polymorpha]|uniref:Uncharacterized protein n=1 Tax=Dreissena polymorpha TaxID=45954 RepID=A0A9D4DD15_DREPO|nr:hypothetical protein DPMN_049197 [Dreissena polymorpha]